MKEQLLNNEALQTLFCEIEAIINDWLLTKASIDLKDLEALTLNHLLLSKTNASLPLGLFSRENISARRHSPQIQYLADILFVAMDSQVSPPSSRALEMLTEQNQFPSWCG